ncbi:MAG: hypothetical protein PHO15_00440 [Eubacteriales bacterium]|nr:hypothetical protein [Eubacteriales bacterium]
MADTLIREGVAYGSQPLSPVPQYWTGSSYEKVQGANGAVRETNYNSSGTEIFTGTTPGSVKLTATSTVAISGTSTVAISGTSTVNFSGSGTVSVSGTATINFSGSGTVVISGTSTVAISGSVTALNQVVGTQANAWSANATISAGATSNSVDLQYCYRISYFGTVTNTASLSLLLQVSQDNTNFYQAATATITAGTSSPFHNSIETAARYARLTTSGVSAIITATIAGK